ncbi:glycoside hydrolase family 30 beta sandwich domain-containing protein [Stigmatella sp. ncwal1]|uniref:Glycoside hydrolase family 30 beta sandwich domain-containing protein n=1 Tax=Stigmatella ashevillensis TaxID=2995309 RepID=A0ABT5D0J2_9BACT|nr:glycoside hydrolase family 30 beta sandwich domain-containing protein [Stigmatella ashevillena]MDC0707186.1 glycoside hydrolase family 30 beta sandwich domain-containing protein [Stigmatella ashevillena]
MNSLTTWKRRVASALACGTLTAGMAASAAPTSQVIWSSEKNPGNGSWFSGPSSIPYALSQQPNIALTSPTSTSATTLAVDPSVQYQTMLGIGTSLEESTIYNLSRMSLAKRTEALKKLLDPSTGAGINLLRITFGTSDFTARQFYTYDDRPAGQTDPNLTYFSIQKDIDYNIISTIKQALAINPNLKIFASPWSPPAWMKDNGSLIGGKLLTQYIPNLAVYYRKAIQAYQSQGIPIYALTVQNEPLYTAPDYPSASVSPAQSKQLILALKNELNANGLSTRIWAFDHNFDSAWSYVPTLLDDATSNAAVDGVAFHDYAGEPSIMTEVRNAYPNKNILMTERAVWGTAGADRMAQYFRNWAAGYNSWVTMLDSNIQPEKWTGTPGPTMLIQSASAYDTYWALPEYYLIAQYSKYVKAGAKRISSSYGSSGTVTNVSFLNPDNTVVSVVINQTAASQRFKLSSDGWELLATLPAKTVGTYTWTRETGPTPQNLLTDPGFENGSLASWNSEWHNVALAHKVDTDTVYTGNYKLTHYWSAAYQQLTGQTKSVANGTYRASAWVRSGGGQRALRLYAKNHGGAEVTAEIGSGAVTGWTQYSINNIQVTTGTIEVGVYSDGNAQNWAAFDQFELVKQ